MQKGSVLHHWHVHVLQEKEAREGSRSKGERCTCGSGVCLYNYYKFLDWSTEATDTKEEAVQGE